MGDIAAAGTPLMVMSARTVGPLNVGPAASRSRALCDGNVSGLNTSRNPQLVKPYTPRVTMQFETPVGDETLPEWGIVCSSLDAVRLARVGIDEPAIHHLINDFLVVLRSRRKASLAVTGPFPVHIGRPVDDDDGSWLDHWSNPGRQ